MTQYFKGDATELKMISAGAPAFDTVGFQKDLFYDNAFEAYPLGEAIYDAKAAPLTSAIVREIFRVSFKEIFEAFVLAGTFESYITVFQKIFGTDVDVEFTVPAPGKLDIDIVATSLELSDLLARRIAGGAYAFDEIIDQDGDNIAVQSFQGFDTQYELEQMLFELVPNGIFTTITLTIS